MVLEWPISIQKLIGPQALFREKILEFWNFDKVNIDFGTKLKNLVFSNILPQTYAKKARQLSEKSTFSSSQRFREVKIFEKTTIWRGWHFRIVHIFEKSKFSGSWHFRITPPKFCVGIIFYMTQSDFFQFETFSSWK